MKHMNIIVSGIIIAAVLVAAYAVGLLVRHIRTQNSQSGSLAATATEDAATLQARAQQQAPGERRSRRAEGPTPEQIRQQREQLLEKMKTMTEEEKRKYTEEQVRKRFSAAGDKGQSRKMSPQEREQKRQILPEEEKPQAAGKQPPAPGGDPNATQKTPTQASEPNKAGQG